MLDRVKEYKRKNDHGTVMYLCQSPITIDKSEEWGSGNVQHHQNGAWVQIKGHLVSHLVACNEMGHPVGWRYDPKYGLFFKNNIFAEKVSDETITLSTLDGEMTYDNKDRNGYVCYNKIGDLADSRDPWFVTCEKFNSMYEEV